MTEYACRYVLARFFRNPIREEAKNIGIILQCPTARFVAGRFEDELDRISPSRSDRIIISRYSQWVSSLLAETKEGASLFTERELAPEFLQKLGSSGIGNIQFTEPRGCVTTDPQRTLDELYAMLVVSDDPIGAEEVVVAGPTKTFTGELYDFLRVGDPVNIGSVKRNKKIKIASRNLAFNCGYERPGNRGTVLYETVDFSAGSLSNHIRAAGPTIAKFSMVARHFDRNRLKRIAVVKTMTNGHTGHDYEELDILKNSADDVFSFYDSAQMGNLLAEFRADFEARIN